MKKEFKKFILPIIILLTFLSSCLLDENSSIEMDKHIQINGINYHISEVSYDGCQYVIFDSDMRSVIHKGNCNNKSHKNH